jgi:hypothetical protein
MSGADDLPLLVLNRVEQGRVAVLASDQSWLWGRGYEGGGPQLELLRRLAHWMLKEPELEEETLTAEVKGEAMTITRRTLAEEEPGPVTITAPDGTVTELAMPLAAPGRYEAGFKAPMLGLYRLEQGDLTRVIAVGPATPREFVETIASGADLAAAWPRRRRAASPGWNRAIPTSAPSPRAVSRWVAAGSASPRARPI